MTRLPSGRHHLSRDEVAGAQRARMLKAAAEVMATQGYPAATVAAIIKRAGVSRETFYQQFPNKQACFIAALEAAIEVLAAAVEPPSAGTPVERFDRFVGTYLDALAENPALARLFLIETYSAGPDAMRRRLELQQHFVNLLAKTFDARSARDRFACQALVGSIVSLVTAHFVANTPDDLVALRAPIVALAQDLLVR
ncbi:TetR/AcrR family transcriptional regulator [Amycolatopsis sp. 195334CR]|uniref:TetR/AcrR family transcriptional regulator n=1 Tax=Amycolatopsis sp. 195334CR TaxID=2814588 RepID=UPI001A8CA37A|nr:TetR/AcrR family transcriptional regulator [Amycolatopsis sp. 195334CR]MBN6040984.1 TetR/AcrR family transcriptional regulator [Amycolatopsis sp. 195334CR]